MHRLTNCPTCNSAALQSVFPGLSGDNTLARLVNKSLPIDLPGFDLQQHATSDWSVCQNCSLLFARHRPDDAGLEKWYPKLFQYSEERNYNSAKLPQSYLDGKAKSAQQLLAVMEEHRVLAQAKTLIQFRTGPGFLLSKAKEKYPDLKVFGLEYFEHPAAYARGLVGDVNIEMTSVPEPRHAFGVAKFDVVVANHLLTHAHNPAALLTYLRSILSDGGRLLLFNEPDHDLTLKSMTAYGRGLNFFHKQLFSRDTLLPFLEGHGFAVKDISKPKKGKINKHMTLLCTKAAAKPIAKREYQDTLKRLQTWRKMHKVYRFGKPIIDPIRKLFLSI